METDVLIIGAGIYGIGLANYLRGRNRSFIVVGKFMDLWRNHTFENMELRSDFKTSEIAHPKGRFGADRFLAEHPEYAKYRETHLPIWVYREYLNWVEANLEFPVIDGFVEKLDFNHDLNFKAGARKKFCASLQNGLQRSVTNNRENARGKNRKKTESADGNMIFAENVVIATGLTPHAFIPPLPYFRGKIIHSCETRKIEKLKNSKALVIGGGQSAAESIEFLKKQKNDVAWLARHPPVFLEQPVNIPAWLFSAIVKSSLVFYFCPDPLRRILIKLLSRPTVRPKYRRMLENTGKETSYNPENNFKNKYDTIIAATGFQFDLENFTFLTAAVKSTIKTRHKTPVLNRTFESTCPGLFFTGAVAENYFGTASRFIIGSHYSALAISKKFRIS